MHTDSDKLIADLCDDIMDARRDGMLTTPQDLPQGLSGNCVIGCLQRFVERICSGGKSCYLEVGVFHGRTLCATALVNPDVACFGVDNFSLFNDDATNLQALRERIRANGIRNAFVLEGDAELILPRVKEYTNGLPVGVYFLDAAHDYRSQLMGLLLARPSLAEGGVIVVDDCNYAHVRRANVDFLATNPDYALLCEAYTPAHPCTMDSAARAQAEITWWNGVNILTHDPDWRLERRVPSCGDSSSYLRMHDIFRHQFAELALDALEFCSTLADAPDLAEDATTVLRQKILEHRTCHPQRKRKQNTDSSQLAPFAISTRRS